MKEESQPATQQGLPTLSKNMIWMISFGFLGVQTAFTLQSSQMSRIFQTLGADPHSLGWFFFCRRWPGFWCSRLWAITSDRTWAPRLGGRRLPYLLYGSLVAVIVMILMPNAGSFGFGYASLNALLFGALMIALLDVSSNMAMQPFKMMVGDMVNDKQKSYAYGIRELFVEHRRGDCGDIAFCVCLYRPGQHGAQRRGAANGDCVVLCGRGDFRDYQRADHFQGERIRPGNLLPAITASMRAPIIKRSVRSIF